MPQETTILPLLVKETEAARLLAVDVSTVRRWRRLGDGPPFVKFGPAQGSPVRYPVDLLQRWVADRVRTLTLGAAQRMDEPGQ